jgi:hypothetical protein
MNRTRSLWMLAVVAGASCVWWTGLQADDNAATAPSSGQVAELLARIEKLERRVETLEQARLVVRKIDRQLVPAAGLLNGGAEDAKPALSHGAIVVPPKAEQRPAGTVFLPRHIELKPE